MQVRANKQMQLTKRKPTFGRPASRADIACWRFAADLQRSMDSPTSHEEDVNERIVAGPWRVAASRATVPTGGEVSTPSNKALELTSPRGTVTGTVGCGAACASRTGAAAQRQRWADRPAADNRSAIA
jgi:hypothetical protein